MFSYTTFDNDEVDGLTFSFDYSSRRRKVQAGLSVGTTEYCLPFVTKHTSDGGCKRCSDYWLMKREETILADPVYPLRSTCIRGNKINHDVGCYTCAWKREITPCLYDMTQFLFNEHGEKDASVSSSIVNGYCLHCDQYHDVSPSNLLTKCSGPRTPCRPYINCQHVSGKRHYWCEYHKGCTVRHVCCVCNGLSYQGQVTSHQTGNHTTATNAGGNVTTINYYGTNYTLANNPSQQSMDPQAIGSGIAGAMEPFNNFIASPTTEELAGDQSDRIMMIMAGNSALITQEAAAGAVTAYGCAPTYLEPQCNSVDLPTRPGPSCDRLYTLESIEWTQNLKQIVIPFPGVLSNTGVFGTNLQYHYLFRSGFLVHIQVNATQFHAGCMLVAVVPECKVVEVQGKESNFDKRAFFDIYYSDQIDSLIEEPSGFRNQLTVFPHQYINLRTTNSATIVWSYNNIVPASCFTTHNIARIVCQVISPIQAPPNNAQSVPITITVQPICSQFNGLRNQVKKQGLPVFEVPGSGQFGTTLANEGFPIYPVWEQIPKFPLAGRCFNLLSVARIPTIVSIDDGKLYLEVQNKSEVGSLIKSWDLSLLSADFEKTYIARLARMFAYYRGTIDLKFTFLGPKQSSGKFLIAYTPPGGSHPDSRDEAMLSTHIIWDVGLQTTISFPVPFTSVSPYRYANRSGDVLSYDGWVTIWYQTAVVFAPGCPTTANILVTASAGEDFTVKGYMDTAYYQGLGDALTGAINQTIEGQITGALNHLPQTLEQPVAGQITQPHQTGHSTALEAAETGVDMVTNPSVAQVVEPGAIVTLNTHETSLENMMSRYFLLESADLTASSGHATQQIDIDINKIFQKGRMLQTVFLSCTYWRFDLDVVVVFSSSKATGKWKVSFAPPGSYTTADQNRFSGVNPCFVSDVNGPPMCFRLPYMIPTSYVCSRFDGYSDFQGGNYGASPGHTFGKLLISSVSKGSSSNNLETRVQIFVRPVNVEGYMPRPLLRFGTGTRSTASRGRIEVGDEENFMAPQSFDAIACYECEDPLPLELPEGPEYLYGEWVDGEFYPEFPVAGVHWWSPWARQLRVYSPVQEEYMFHHMYMGLTEIMFTEDVDLKFERWRSTERCKNMYLVNKILAEYYEVCRRHIVFARVALDNGYDSGIEYQGLIKNAADQVADSFSSAFAKAMEKLKATEADIKMDWWAKALGIATKFVSFSVLIMKSRSDPTVLAAIGALIAVDIVDACPFSWMRDEICKLFGVPTHQGGTNFFREFNAITTAAKGVEWIISKVKELIDWLVNKFKPHVEEIERDACDLELLSENLREWRQFQTNPTEFTESSVLDLCSNLIQLRDKLEKLEPNSPVLRYIAPTMTSVHKYVANTKHRKCEPIGVVIHGRPGSGKSLATQMLGRNMSKYFGGDQPYSLPPDPKYFDNYTCQPVVIMDDLGQNPDGEDMKMICQMISATDYVTPQADNPEKGRPFLSRLILASTNCDHLRPPTISHPGALERRFAFDLDVVSFPTFVKDGTLDMEAAFQKCDHDSLCYTGCCPFICGKAIAFKDRRTKEILSLDQLTIKLRRLDKEKMALSTKMDVYLQGPIVKGKVLRKVCMDDLSTMGRKPLTKDMIDLIENADDKKAMVQYAFDLGYEVPDDILCGTVLSVTREISSAWKVKMMTLGAIITILTTALFVWKMWPTQQEGPYDGFPQKKLIAPQRRIVEAQGNTDPDTEFAISLMRHNLFAMETAAGRFTVLGLYGKTVLMPRHAAFGPYYVDGREVKPGKEFDLYSRGLVTELTCIEFPEMQDFKDLRKFLVDDIQTFSDVVLAVNSDAFPRTVIPIRKVYPFGTLNIEGESTANTIYYTTPTRRGYCGGILVKAGKIIGMHIAGDGTNGYSALLKKSYFSHFEGEMSPLKKSGVSINLNTKTSLQPSVYHHLIDVKKGPAVLKNGDPRCEVDFTTSLFSKYKGNSTQIPPFIENAIDHYVEQLRPLLPSNVTDKITLDEAVDGFGRLEGLALETSAGYPYCTQGVKKRHLVADNKKRLIEGLNLHGFDLPYVTCLKDELRGLDKIKQGKTRLIECSSVNDTIRAKITFGRLYEAFITNPGVGTGSAVGCNPDVHWTKFATEMGNNVFAFDYKNFDASLAPVWFDALKKVLKGLGYSETDLKVIDHMCVSKHLFKDEEYTVIGGMPSGCSGTSIFNSMINNLIIKSLCMEAYKGVDLDQLKIIAYGDDVIISYPFPLEPKLFAEIGSRYGLEITPADKGVDFGEPGPITSVTFLKRSFVPDETYPFLFHPVFPYDEVLQSLAWTKDPRTMPEHVRSLAYLVWHEGKQRYADFQALVRSVPVGRAFHTPPFSQLRTDWLDSF